MPTEPRARGVADYLRVTDKVFTDAAGRRWQLALDESTSPPTPVFVAVMTWARFKQLWPTWEKVKQGGRTWAIVKAS